MDCVADSAAASDGKAGGVVSGSTHEPKAGQHAEEGAPKVKVEPSGAATAGSGTCKNVTG